MMSLLEARTTVDGQFDRIKRRHVAAQMATLLLEVRNAAMPHHRLVMLSTIIGMQLLSTVFSTITSQASRDLLLITYFIKHKAQWKQNYQKIYVRSTSEITTEPQARMTFLGFWIKCRLYLQCLQQWNSFRLLSDA